MGTKTAPEFHEQAPDYTEIRERSPSGENNPTGGVVVHRCHPNTEPTDYFALASRHETMRGYVTKNVLLYESSVSESISVGVSRWNKAADSCHMCAGSHEDCSVCQGTASERELLYEVVDMATGQVGGEHNVARTGVYDEHAVVYIDSHGMGSESGPYSTNNSTRHWDNRIQQHPYVYIKSAEEIENGANWSEPNQTLRIQLETYYPDGVPTPIC